MASSFSLCSSPMITPNHVSIKGPISSRSTAVMCANNHSSFDLRIGSSHKKKKVFEDGSTGIVCYRDEKGEITCEGYDEGPRIHHQLSAFCIKTRDAEIIEMLERSWLQVAAHHNEL